MLPDGTLFRSLGTAAASYSQTYHVAQGDPQAGDENPGTAERPWRTIGKAAAALLPGERVIVHRGVYREWVRPERGGAGPDEMIWYEAAPGEDVQIKGSELWSPGWQATDSAWRTALDPKLFPGENPFALENFPVQPSAEWKRFPSMALRRGQLFLDGKPLMQVAKREELVQAEDSFWVEPDGKGDPDSAGWRRISPRAEASSWPVASRSSRRWKRGLTTSVSLASVSSTPPTRYRSRRPNTAH